MHRSIVVLALASISVLALACNGSTLQTPTSQVKQCLFDTECMSSQRCAREKDNVMGVCVDKVASQPADPNAPNLSSGTQPLPPPQGSSQPSLPPSQPQTQPSPQPQPGDISL